MTIVNDDNMKALLQRVIDEDEIKRVLYEYAFHLDAADPESMLPVFLPDCYVAYGPDHGAHGAEEYLHTLGNEKTGIAAFFAATSHHVSNVVIDFKDADTATVRSVLYAFHKYNRERPDGILYGQYHDLFVRTADGWRIARRDLKTAATENYHAKPAALVPTDRRNKEN